MIILCSCEQDEDLVEIEQLQNEQQIVTQSLIDTTYTDAVLKKVLEEELDFLKSGNGKRNRNISGMDIVKENPKKVYVHYMPWFQSKEYDGFWGQHWTMNTQNPDIQDENEKHQIASYYYPLIGPYSSADPDLQEYHFLMMKLSGIDGVIFNWYGTRDLHDYGLIKDATETFMGTLEDLGLQFSIMYEDRVAFQSVSESSGIIENAQNDLAYINSTYFSSPEYMKFNGKNLLFVFGPNYIKTPSAWDQIFNILPAQDRPEFLTLWNSSEQVGANATGEFLWVDKDHLIAHEHYYYNQLYDDKKIIVGSSYPGFKSFYSEGGWFNGINNWSIDSNKGRTFIETLNYTHHELSDFIQVITWNDFGEGTMIEPTQEFGFTYLKTLQQYTQVPYTTNDLRIALNLYKMRKKYKQNPEVQQLLDQSYQYIKQLNLKRVHKILQAIKRFY
ncbi:hypothetical protein GCM10022393_24340 [Aquimarina addita]|uniref:Glycosyl hydrolase family 99 n=2 Tax=Aquimarina addita TaxID=870485 RepID=A0ABP6UKA1_9FLAO